LFPYLGKLNSSHCHYIIPHLILSGKARSLPSVWSPVRGSLGYLGKYWIKVEVTDSDKHISSLRYRLITSVKSFTVWAPDGKIV
jgi:hypothetical protein